jgi:hypothetical protein
MVPPYYVTKILEKHGLSHRRRSMKRHIISIGLVVVCMVLTTVAQDIKGAAAGALKSAGGGSSAGGGEVSAGL